VNVSYAGVVALLSQITISKRGDIFVAPSPDIMKKAETRGHIVKNVTRNIGYFVPAMMFRKEIRINSIP